MSRPKLAVQMFIEPHLGSFLGPSITKLQQFGGFFHGVSLQLPERPGANRGVGVMIFERGTLRRKVPMQHPCDMDWHPKDR